MANDALPQSLQESICTALVYDSRFGALIAAQVEPDNFDEPFREIVRRVLTYRKRYAIPPGHEHIDDLFGSALDEAGAQQLRRAVIGMSQQADGLNAEYVASRVNEFTSAQRIKQALMSASERYHAGGDGYLDDVKGLLYGALRDTSETLDSGIFLNDVKRGLAFLDTPEQTLRLGIRELDALNIGPAPKEMLLYIGPKGTGKTWFAVHCGKQGLWHRQKVVHITNETSRERVVMRYYQSLFSVARRSDNIDGVILQFDRPKIDEPERVSGWEKTKRTPSMNLGDPEIYKKLRKEIRKMGGRIGQLVVQEYPTRSLTMTGLVSYLDFLEQAHKFIPTLLIIDSPDLMKIPINDFRLNLGRMYEELRGLAAKRSYALVCTTQGTRKSIGAKQVGSKDVGEDISKVQTADNVLTFAATKTEQELGLGRLTVEHARNAEGGIRVALAQSYPMGQYVLQSGRMDQRYYDKLKEKTGKNIDAEED